MFSIIMRQRPRSSCRRLVQRWKLEGVLCVWQQKYWLWNATQTAGPGLTGNPCNVPQPSHKSWPCTNSVLSTRLVPRLRGETWYENSVEKTTLVNVDVQPPMTALFSCTTPPSSPSLLFASIIKSGSPSKIAFPTSLHFSNPFSSFIGRKTHSRSGTHDPPAR